MDFSGRLKIVVDKTRLNREAFAEIAGVSRAQFFNYLGGKGEPNASFFRNIKEAFPWVNLEWLIMGKESVIAAEKSQNYGGKAPIQERIIQTLAEMDEKVQRDVLKYAEDKKLLAELVSERQVKKVG